MLRLLLYLLPLGLLSRVVGFLVHFPFPRPVTRWMIGWYCRHFRIDLAEVEGPVESFRTLGDFFVRRLRPGARPIDPSADTIVSPVDGCVSESGAIEAGTLVQAKGRRFTVEDLLAGPSDRYRWFVTLYLSPRDYHRIHAPCHGRIVRTRHIPGRLFPVNPYAVREIPDLFPRNERVVTFMESEAGPLALVSVAATNVGDIVLEYDPSLRTNRLFGRQRVERSYDPPLPVAKGEEIARFEMGSTVILLLPEGVETRLDVAPGTPVRMGSAIARFHSISPPRMAEPPPSERKRETP